jgi:hypothetical protein
MLDTPLIETLRHLSEAELQQLDKFVHSRLFYHEDNASGVMALFEDIIRYAPRFDSPELDRQRVAERLKQTPQYIAKINSGLHAVLRRYLAWAFAEDKNDSFSEQLALLSFYRQRGLVNRFESLYEKLEKELLETSVQRSKIFYERKFRLNAQRNMFLTLLKPVGDLNLPFTLNSFDEYYLLQKAQYTFNLLLRQKNFTLNTEGYAHVVTEDIMRYFERQTPQPDMPILRLFYEAILLMVGKPEANFDHFQSLLDTHESLLSNYDFHSLRGLERQYLATRFNAGEQNLLRPVFDLYRQHLSKGLLEANGYIMPTVFSNIVRHGCRLGELEWIAQFLETYKNRLGGVINPKELYRLYYAYYLVYAGRWKEAEENLNADFEDAITKVEARCVELMLLYESRSDVLEYKIESFRKLIRNSTVLPEVRREGFHNFALTLRKMINPDLKRNDRKIDKLIEEIANQKTTEAAWLINRLEKLKSRR